MPDYGAQQYGQYAPNPVAVEELVFLGRYAIKVDWDGDGLFANAYSDVSASAFDCQTQRGRDYASQLNGRAVAGQARVTLDNRDGRFSSFNAASPIYGKILPNRKVYVSSVGPYAAMLWTGFLDRIEPVAGGRPMATLSASGAFLQLGSQANLISPAPQAGVQTDSVISAILDAAGWPAADRAIEAGYVSVGNWFKEQAVALGCLQEIADDTEQGFGYEGIAWDYVFENRYHRTLSAAGRNSQASFSDAASAAYHYEDIRQQDPLREIYNAFTATVQPYATGILSVLWTLAGETLTLSPGTSGTYTAQYSNGYVSAWTTPVVGTDVVLGPGLAVNGDIAIVAVKGARSMRITVTNNGSYPALFTLIQARGIAVTPLNPYQVLAVDAASQTAYGKRAYPLPSPWYPNAPFAQAACDFFVSQKKDPHPVVEITLHAGADPMLFIQAVSRAISDRITVVATGLLTSLGISGDFYIEAISHHFGARTPLTTTWILSPASVQTNYWILGDATYGVLGSTTRLGY